ncbi:MAG: hypothetical protein ACLSHC_00200 [Bilophila wadsworthia]
MKAASNSSPGPRHRRRLPQRCDPGEAGSTLIILEVRGLIRQRPDLRYALT